MTRWSRSSIRGTYRAGRRFGLGRDSLRPAICFQTVRITGFSNRLQGAKSETEYREPLVRTVRRPGPAWADAWGKPGPLPKAGATSSGPPPPESRRLALEGADIDDQGPVAIAVPGPGDAALVLEGGEVVVPAVDGLAARQ